MKLIHSSSRFLKSIAAVALVAVALAGSAFATVPGLPLYYYTGIDLGAAGWRYLGQPSEWSVFALTGGVTATATTQGPSDQTVVGDVGMNSGNLSISGNAFINGKGFVRSGGTLIRSGAAKIVGTGTVGSPSNTVDVSVDTGNRVGQAYNDAIGASSYAATKPTELGGIMPVGWAVSSAVSQSSDFSLTAPGKKIVLNLTDFILTAGAKFTLSGDQYTSLVINISNTLSLVGGKIILDGVLSGNVIFNVTGTGSNVTLTGGATYDGILLAPNRVANISGAASVNGTVIAKTVNISGNSHLVKPTYLSP